MKIKYILLNNFLRNFRWKCIKYISVVVLVKENTLEPLDKV
jgi:hypothetical protein